MKVLAILTLMPQAQLETVRAELANELKLSWALYASGVLREVYATEDAKRVVFIVASADIDAARQVLAPLPMIAAGMFHMEFVELRPFVNWSMLFAH
jgi:muconolactone delta-isomerase